MSKILLLGKTGYIGSQFHEEIIKRGWDYHAVSRKEHDYTWNEELIPLLRNDIHFVINCAAFIPKESVRLCDNFPEETIKANVVFPSTLSTLCSQFSIPVAHISTGCLWDDGQEHNEGDLPQRAFKGYCGFYVGTKWMSEQEVRNTNHNHYVWRVRLPFGEVDNDRNYLSKLVRFPKVWDHNNSVSHRGDFVKACLDLWQLRAPFGTYNVMNPGSVRAVEIVEQMLDMGIIKAMPEIVTGQPGDCQVNVEKIQKVGVKIRHVNDAIADALKNWHTETCV
jgi:dTDP-4-dehydrorhamnose reductase